MYDAELGGRCDVHEAFLIFDPVVRAVTYPSIFFLSSELFMHALQALLAVRFEI